jgi:hypothetical protein
MLIIKQNIKPKQKGAESECQVHMTSFSPLGLEISVSFHLFGLLESDRCFLLILKSLASIHSNVACPEFPLSSSFWSLKTHHYLPPHPPAN